MLLRRFTDFVLENRTQTMATVFLSAFLPLIGSISILIATLVTLRKGAFEGALVIIAATLPYIISYFVSAPPPNQIVVAVGVLSIIIISNLMTWVFAVILRRFSSWSMTLEIAALFGIVIVGVIHFIFPDVQNWWGAQLKIYFSKMSEIAVEAGASKTLTDAQIQTIASMKYYATGLIVTMVLFNALLQLLIARWWQAVIFNPGGLRPELYNIRLGHIASLVFISGFILALLGNDLAIDIMPVMYMIFFVAGLSVIHQLIYRLQNSWRWIVLFYFLIIILFLLFPSTLVLIAMIALLDTGLDFRKRLTKI